MSSLNLSKIPTALQKSDLSPPPMFILALRGTADPPYFVRLLVLTMGVTL